MFCSKSLVHILFTLAAPGFDSPASYTSSQCFHWHLERWSNPAASAQQQPSWTANRKATSAAKGPGIGTGILNALVNHRSHHLSLDFRTAQVFFKKQIQSSMLTSTDLGCQPCSPARSSSRGPAMSFSIVPYQLRPALTMDNLRNEYIPNKNEREPWAMRASKFSNSRDFSYINYKFKITFISWNHGHIKNYSTPFWLTRTFPPEDPHWKCLPW